MTENTTTTNVIAYDAFARIMNDDWGVASAEIYFPSIEELLRKNNFTNQSSILDIFCGAGHLVQKLQDQGYQVAGLDSSPELLNYARNRSPQSKFILEDACHFKLPDSFDVVISTAFGFNHINQLEDLTLAFKNVYDSLKTDGLFAFDIRLNKLYKGGWNRSIIGDVNDEYAWTMIRLYNQKTRIGENHFTIFEPVDNGWERSKDLKWIAKGYEIQEIVSSLKNAKFSEINCKERKKKKKWFTKAKKEGIYDFVARKR